MERAAGMCRYAGRLCLRFDNGPSRATTIRTTSVWIRIEILARQVYSRPARVNSRASKRMFAIQCPQTALSNDPRAQNTQVRLPAILASMPVQPAAGNDRVALAGQTTGSPCGAGSGGPLPQSRPSTKYTRSHPRIGWVLPGGAMTVG